MKGLDRYLTQEPRCDFSEYAEAVCEAFPEEFYNKNEDWIMDDYGLCGFWLRGLYIRDTPTEDATRIIMRAFSFYKI